MQIQQFRKAVYQSITKRAGSFLDLLDALTVASHVESPVALSEERPFRRKFSSIFFTLLSCEFDFDHLINSLHHYQPANNETIAGYEMYAADSTPIERSNSETLEDTGSLKTQKDAPVRYGHKYSWLARLIHWGNSWVAPIDVQRVAQALTDNQVAAVQVQELDARNKQS